MSGQDSELSETFETMVTTHLISTLAKSIDKWKRGEGTEKVDGEEDRNHLSYFLYSEVLETHLASRLLDGIAGPPLTQISM